MKRSYTLLNIFFLFLLFFAIGGCFSLWRARISNTFAPRAFDPVIPVTPRDQLQPKVTSTENMKIVASTSSTIKNVVSTSSTQNKVSTSTPSGIKELPKQINLAVPFTSQAPEKNWDEPWQDACEEAAVLMLDAYYKDYKLSTLFSRDEILKMVNWEENVNGWGRSIEIEKIQSLTQYYSKRSAHLIENPTVEQIKQYVAAGTPVYVVADGKLLPNPHFQNGGPAYHALIIRGYTQDSFITNDPGTQFGENYVYKYNDLMKSIRDWNMGDVKNGRRVVLVI